MGLIQPEAKNLCRWNYPEHLAEECSVLFPLLQHDKSHEEQTAEINPFHPNTSPQNTAAQVKITGIFYFSCLYFPFQKSPNRGRKIYLKGHYHRHIKMFAGYGFVYTIFCSSKNCKRFVSITNTKSLIWCICFFLLFLPEVSFAVKEQFFSE